jgi:hypothetical protein
MMVSLEICYLYHSLHSEPQDKRTRAILIKLSYRNKRNFTRPVKLARGLLLGCITCFQNGTFAWAARDLTPGGTSSRAELHQFSPNHHPSSPPANPRIWIADTFVFCSCTPIPTPNQPKSPCDTLGSSTKSAFCRFFFQPCLSSLSTPQTLLLASSSRPSRLRGGIPAFHCHLFVWGQECRYGRGSRHQTERCAKQAATLEFRSTQLSDMEVRWSPMPPSFAKS